MPTYKISGLPAVTSIAGTEELEVNQAGTSRKATRTQLVAGLVSAGAITGSGLTMSTNRVLGRSTSGSGAIEELTAVPVSVGGTGLSTIPTNGQVLIGNGTGYTAATLTAGTNITITNGSGTITIAATGGGSLAGQTDTATPFETALGHQAGNVNTGVRNTFIGYQAGLVNSTGFDNVAVGYQALDANTSGSDNLAVGSEALGANTTGIDNIALGSNQTLVANTTGSYNTIAGSEAGKANTTGNFNTGYGYKALQQNTTGASNVAVGFRAAEGNTTGARNVAIGEVALFTNSTASDCVAVGGSALRLSTGASNTAVGQTAGDGITTGTQNTLLGQAAGSSGTNDLTTGSNNTLIGYNAAASSATVSNEITLGNSSIATLRCQVTTITALSDLRDKREVRDLLPSLHFVKKLRPVHFEWAMRDGGKVGEADTGFIAQDLQAVQAETGITIPGLVYDNNPDRLEAGYGKLLPVLVKAIQELAAEVESLKAQLAGR